jgi:hypothetical protein
VKLSLVHPSRNHPPLQQPQARAGGANRQTAYRRGAARSSRRSRGCQRIAIKTAGHFMSRRSRPPKWQGEATASPDQENRHHDEPQRIGDQWLGRPERPQFAARGEEHRDVELDLDERRTRRATDSWRRSRIAGCTSSGRIAVSDTTSGRTISVGNTREFLTSRMR